MKKTMIFAGYEDGMTFGDGAFTVGKEYEMVSEINTYRNGDKPDAIFIDDNEEEMWEEIEYFKA